MKSIGYAVGPTTAIDYSMKLVPWSMWSAVGPTTQGWIFCIFAPQMPSQDWEFSKSIKIGMVDLRVCWTKSDKELLMYNVIQSLDSPYNDFNDVKSCKLKGNLDIYVVY